MRLEDDAEPNKSEQVKDEVMKMLINTIKQDIYVKSSNSAFEKSLLYLRDQIKDFDAKINVLERERNI